MEIQAGKCRYHPVTEVSIAEVFVSLCVPQCACVCVCVCVRAGGRACMCPFVPPLLSLSLSLSLAGL